MLIDDIKKRFMQAMKDKKTVEKEVLRVLIGEIQTAESRATSPFTDEEALNIVRKLVKSNQETLAATSNEADKGTLTQELEILNSLLPASLSVEQIVAALAPVSDNIKAAGNDGQATGIAMKQLKASGATVNGKDVSAAVKQIRS